MCIMEKSVVDTSTHNCYIVYIVRKILTSIDLYLLHLVNQAIRYSTLYSWISPETRNYRNQGKQRNRAPALGVAYKRILLMTH